MQLRKRTRQSLAFKGKAMKGGFRGSGYDLPFATTKEKVFAVAFSVIFIIAVGILLYFLLD